MTAGMGALVLALALVSRAVRVPELASPRGRPQRVSEEDDDQEAVGRYSEVEGHQMEARLF